MLPSDNDDYAYDNDKVEMWLYLDVSGSCANLRNDFIVHHLRFLTIELKCVHSALIQK